MTLAGMRTVNLPPDVFAVVMATGICSVAAKDHGQRVLSLVLAVLASAAFVVLALGLVIRFASGYQDVVAQARDPDVALRMFTATAACEVLGNRWQAHSAVLWFSVGLAAASWLVLAPLAVADVRRHQRRDLRDHAHGAWLLPSVAASGLGSVVATAAGRTTHWLGDLAAIGWLIGLVLYGVVTWLVLWHITTRLRGTVREGGDPVPPDSWILMGALAIATLAGSRVVSAATGWVATGARDLTLVCLLAASAWVPVLLYAEVWQLNRHSGALQYAGVWWSAVFPLGMYAAATEACAPIFHTHTLVTVSLVFFWNAITVWVMVAVGWLHHGARRLRPR